MKSTTPLFPRMVALFVVCAASVSWGCKARTLDLNASLKSQSVWTIEPDDRVAAECKIKYISSSDLKNPLMFIEAGDLANGQSIKIVAKPKQSLQRFARLVVSMGKSSFIQQMMNDNASIANPLYQTWVGYYGRSDKNSCQDLSVERKSPETCFFTFIKRIKDDMGSFVIYTSSSLNPRLRDQHPDFDAVLAFKYEKISFTGDSTVLQKETRLASLMCRTAKEPESI